MGSQSNVSRGKCGRTLQGNTRMAKHALQAALSVDSKPINGPNLFSDRPLHRASTAANYASSTQNISRLLEGWMKKPLESVKKESRTTGRHYYPKNSSANGSSSTEDHEVISFSPYSGATQSEEDTHNLTPETSTFRDGSGRASILCQDDASALKLFEKWLLDEGALPSGENLSLFWKPSSSRFE